MQFLLISIEEIVNLYLKSRCKQQNYFICIIRQIRYKLVYLWLMRLFQSTMSKMYTGLIHKSVANVSRIPRFVQNWKQDQSQIHILTLNEAAQIIPAHKLKEFQDKKQAKSTVVEGNSADAKEITHTYYSQSSWKKIAEISSNSSIRFSNGIQNSANFLGIATEVLMKGYKFSRKEKPEKEVEISLQNIAQRNYILELVNAKIRAAQLANSRGDEINTIEMLQKAKKIAQDYPQAKIQIIQGEQLLKEGFRLLHAVGRASQNPPIFVSLQYKGIPESDQFISLVGKGLCFDAGGLNLKPTSGIAGMHNDKHGSCSVLSAFQAAVRLKVKQNVVAVIGLAENFISSNSYRPLDIIKSRKGITVQIGNTDAEGRLVLADCMNWVQQKYKVKTMLELSTLTGAIIIALGKNRAGVFTNTPSLAAEVANVGQQIQELNWHMPLDEYHEDLIKAKQADITNSSGKADGSSCQAAAFLKNFVEKDVEWAHIDIAGVADAGSYSTGYGAKLLTHFLTKRSK